MFMCVMRNLKKKCTTKKIVILERKREPIFNVINRDFYIHPCVVHFLELERSGLYRVSCNVTHIQIYSSIIKKN